MGKQVPKMSARVVTAIRSLREAQGSTSKEIMNYIKSQYDASDSTIQRQMQAALKRGLDYGILKMNNGHYFLNTDADIEDVAAAIAPLEKRGRRRRRRRRRSRRGKSRRGSRRRSRRRGHRRGRRARSRRGRGRGRANRMGGGRCSCTSKKAKDMLVLGNSPVEQDVPDDTVSCHDPDADVDRRSRQSKSRDRSLSGSGSSTKSDREIDDERRIDL